MRPTLELRRQDQVHEQKSQPQRDHEDSRTSRDSALGLAREFEVILRRQVHRGQNLCRFLHRLGERDLLGIRQDRHGPLAVEAIDFTGPRDSVHFGQAAQLHESHLGRLHGSTSDGLRVGPDCLSRSHTSYCSVPSVNREIGWPPTSTVSVLAIVWIGMPRSLARLAIDRHLHLRLAQRRAWCRRPTARGSAQFF